jgi:hypothetical protein
MGRAGSTHGSGMRGTCPADLVLLNLLIKIAFGEEYTF